MSEPSDPSEREADRVAKDLFPTSGRPRIAAAATGVQRASKGGTPSGTTAGRVPGGARDPGSPLPAATRHEMEGAFGADLSAVRIHTGPEAAQLSRGLKASAFTYGDHIFFDHGSYDPVAPSGKQLLAHELTHTIQQREAGATFDRQGGGPTVLQCVNDNLSSAGVASWVLAIVGATCGLVGALAGSPSGPGAAGTAATAAAGCIALVIGASVGFVLGIISGCWSDPNHKSAGAHLSSAGGPGSGAGAGAGGPGAGAPAAPAPSGTATA